jgi:excisionase family DNA binding protein
MDDNVIMTLDDLSKKQYLTPNEAAELLMVSPITVRQWAQKGELKALTTPGGHRRFLVRDLEEFAQQRGLTLPLQNDDGDGRRVLIVDDDKQLAGFLQEYFHINYPDFRIMAAYDGFDAGQKVQTFQPDLILLDIMMPGLSGIEVCKLLKSDDSTKGIRIFAMTGFYTSDMVSQIVKAGAQECFKKPLDLEILSQKIELHLAIDETLKNSVT